MDAAFLLHEVFFCLRKFDQQLEQAVEKMKRRESNLPPLPPAPRHTVCRLHPNMSSQLFTQVCVSDTGTQTQVEVLHKY